MPPLAERQLSIIQLRRWSEAGRVFAVLDACDAPSVPARVRDLGDHRMVSLYRGQAEEELWGIAPYLVHLDPPTVDWITESLWPTPWGIFAVADCGLDELRTHLRRFLVVESPEGERWYFRFYDPRVLPRFLAACDDGERRALFGPVRAFGVTDPETYGVRLLLEGPAAAVDAPGRPAVRVVRR